MSYDYLIDSYAWIEYFRGTEKGETAKPLIEGGKSATSSISLAELSEKYLRENLDFEEDLKFIISSTKIIDVDKEIALSAGAMNFENKKKIKDWGMADAIILASAKKLNAKVVTGDKHFQGMDSVLI